MSTTLSVLSTTGLEIETEPFILDLSLPCSCSTPSTPTTDCSDPNNSTDIRSKTTSETSLSYASSIPHSECIKADFFNESSGENLLDFLFSPTEPCLTLFETLAQDPTPAARAALIYYMSFAPLVQRDISALVPSLLHYEEVMNGIATNVGQFYARGFISDTEVEYLLMQILVCENPKGANDHEMDHRILDLYHLTHQQIGHYRTTVKRPHEEIEQWQYLKKRRKMREKTLQRQKGNARRSLCRDFFEDPGVPLPYGCSNLAEVFTDVNEMYTLSALPGVDWAQSRPSSHQSLGIELRRAMVRFPDNCIDKRALNVFGKTTMEPTRVSESFSRTRVPLESLGFSTRSEATPIDVKLP